MIFYLSTKEVELRPGTPLKYTSVTPKKLIGGKSFFEIVVLKKLFQVMPPDLTYLTLPSFLTF